MTALAKLKLVSVTAGLKSPMVLRRNKLTGKVHDQIQLAKAAIAGDVYAAKKQKFVTDSETGERKQVELAYKLAAGRAPKPSEMKLALQFLKVKPAAAALDQFALAMFNLNGFLYVN